MIDEIQVENLALIRDASLVPAQTLTVLTGETGAGKTALLTACKLLMGERADKGAVREGASSLVVEGRFFLQNESEEYVVARRVGADGRSRVALNGHMASVGELSELISPTLDLCSQHEHQKLMRSASHVHMLDAWGNESISEAYCAYSDAYDEASAAADELARVRDACDASSAKLDEARFVLQRIEAARLHEGEYEELSAYLARAEHAEALALAAHAAHAALAEEGGALDTMAAAIAAFEDAAKYDSALSDCATTLREAGYMVEDVAREALDYRDSVEYDQQELAAAQERMSVLQGLLRAYGPRMEDVLMRRDQAADLVSLVDKREQREQAAQRACDVAEEALANAAAALDAARAEAAPLFAAAVTAQMGRLNMGSASLVCSCTPLERALWTKTGPSAVEFLFCPSAHMQARPLARIASGGEISRVMLAIKVVLGASDEVETLVFDEVDAGVGGATAVALAGVLADLSTTHQVIVVTHLAQVAARADVHYVVEKTEEDLPETHLTIVEGDARVAEIARMLSGSITDTSCAHARELLENSNNFCAGEEESKA